MSKPRTETTVNPRELIRSWLAGRAGLADGTLELTPRPALERAARFRHAYEWIASHAIHSPFHDLTLEPPVAWGRPEAQVELPRGASYSSFILLPLLTLITARRMVFVGGPGRGKTTMATLMALLAGAPLEDVRQAIQHGHPQLTIADLLGSPLPGDLIKAERSQDVHVAWRRWITARVKIIDEYNRIPTKTQSALLSLMAEGYAEMYEQVVRCGRSAWYLTANDDQGGGTFPVIEALKDRIDLVVRCTPFHARFLDPLADRVATARSPEEFVPADLICSAADLDAADEEVRGLPLDEKVREVLGFFLSQLDFCRRASQKLEFQNKDTLHLAGRRLAHVCTEDCPLDKQENLCTQTESGVSARAVQTLLHYAKALAWFRSASSVGLNEVRALLPWVLHDKLPINPQSGFFQKTENQHFLLDRVAWIQQLFDRAVVQHAAYQPARKGTLELQQVTPPNLRGVPTPELRLRLEAVQKRIEEVLQREELSGAVHSDLVLLKDLHVRCHNELLRRETGKE
jgi:MoxR-like ATPase